MADYSAEQRQSMLAEGHALPPLEEGGDPRYPIATCADVTHARKDAGRTEADSEVRAYINRRARELGCTGPEHEEAPEREHRYFR